MTSRRTSMNILVFVDVTLVVNHSQPVTSASGGLSAKYSGTAHECGLPRGHAMFIGLGS